MRVLFTAASGIGHIHPLLPLAQAFVDGDHDVRFATGPDLGPAVESAGLHFVAAGLTQRERRDSYYEKYRAESEALAPHQLPDFMFPRIFGELSTPRMLADLRPILSDWTPDLFVHEGAELAAPLLAAEVGARRAAHSFGSVTPPHRLQAATERVAHLWAESGRAVPEYSGVYDDIYIDIRPPSLSEDLPLPATVIRRRPMAADAIGGELPPIVTADDPRPLVYLTLGTVFTPPEVLRDAALGLSRLPVRLLVTVGPNGDPAALGDLPSDVVVTRYVPQTELLAHCTLVVSHAGSGTFLGALAAGLPQLCLPQGADQFLNAADGERAGVSVTVHPETMTPDTVHDAAATLLADPRCRAAAEATAAEIAAMSSPADVAAHLETLVLAG